MPDGPGQSTDDALDDLLARAIEASEGIDPASLVAVVTPTEDALRAAEPGVPPTRDELRRLTIMFSDLVGSTSLSAHLDPETYRSVLSSYKDTCRRVIEDEFEGHLVHTRGDGILAVFGYPTAHEDDALRAVRAGLGIHRALAEASADVRTRTGVDLAARVGVHRGLVYVERDTEELYGFAVNVAARVQEAAEPGTVVISAEVERLVHGWVWAVPIEARAMKGVDRVPSLHRVLEEMPRPAPGVRRWPTALVGRATALDELRQLWVVAGTAAQPVATVVAGDPGVGKSRLVGAFLDELPRGTPVLEMGGSPFHQRHGLHPIRELLDDWAQVRRDRPPADQLVALGAHLRRRKLEHLLPLLAPVAGLGPEAGYEPAEADPRRLEELIAAAVHEVLTDWFGGAPGIVFVEDLHWLDQATQQVLARLVRSGPAGLLVLITCRDDRSLGVPVHHLHLDPLAAADCLELVRLHDADIPDDAATEVVGRSDGIPLFVEELVRSRHEVVDADPAVDIGGDGSVPSALYEPLYARLNTLADSRIVASAAATLGRTVSLDLLARVSGVTTSELDHAVTALMDQRVLEVQHGDGRSVRFRHELVRLVAYELEPPSGRQRLHSLAAECLSSGEGATGMDWSLIAEHHRSGGQATAAALAFERAADDARLRGSLDEARGSFDRALEVLQLAAPGEERDQLEIQLRLHRAFLAVSSEGFGSEQAAADYRRSLELCVEQPASAEMYRALIALWGYYINRSDLERAWSVSTALRGLSQGNRVSMLPTNEAGFGMIEWYRGSFREAARRLAAAVAAIDEVGVDDSSIPAAWTMPLDPIASMHIHLGMALAWVGDLTGSAEQVAAARARCGALPFPLGPFTLGYVLLLDAHIWTHLDDFSGARERVRDVLASAQHHGFDAWLFWASISDRTLDGFLEAGADPEAIAAEVAMSVELWHGIGVRVHTGSMRCLLGRMLLEAGDAGAALAVAKAALATAEETTTVATLADSLLVLALAGPSDQVDPGLREALAVADDQGAGTAAVRIATELVRVGGDGERPLLEAALARIVGGEDAPVIAAARSVLGAP